MELRLFRLVFSQNSRNYASVAVEAGRWTSLLMVVGGDCGKRWWWEMGVIGDGMNIWRSCEGSRWRALLMINY